MTQKRLALTFVALLALVGCSSGYPAYHGRAIVPGESVTVQKGQTVYGIAKQYKVPTQDVIALNRLAPPYVLRVGQTIVLPAGSGADMPPPDAAPVAGVTTESLPSALSAPVQTEDLAAPSPSQSLDPHGMPFGQPTPLSPTTAQSAPSITSATPPAQEEVLPQALQPSPLIPAAPQQAASAATGAASSVSPATVAAAPKFAWPLQGPVLSAYGPKAQGQNNDGLNIGAPKGAPVQAAAPGTVVYAGDEMKGFGNLVLIRHKDGWITAYAHLDRMIVDKDSVVAQGDMIGTVGSTGGVSAPQLHFEIRQDGKPIDPSPFLAGR